MPQQRIAAHPEFGSVAACRRAAWAHASTGNHLDLGLCSPPLRTRSLSGVRFGSAVVVRSAGVQGVAAGPAIALVAAATAEEVVVAPVALDVVVSATATNDVVATSGI